MQRILVLAMTAFSPLVALAQEDTSPPSFLDVVITWTPFLVLIALWFFFMKRVNVFGKGGYRDYMRVTQERVERIETHLADIAASLRKIADAQDRQP